MSLSRYRGAHGPSGTGVRQILLISFFLSRHIQTYIHTYLCILNLMLIYLKANERVNILCGLIKILRMKICKVYNKYKRKYKFCEKEQQRRRYFLK